jgi:hypothetical protein
MACKPAPEPDDSEQSARFIEMAREIGAVETEREADEAIEKIIRPKSPLPKKSRDVRFLSRSNDRSLT